jgi:hypothetical protein
VTLFHEIALVFNVVEAAMLNVEPVVVTVPDVQVNVPVVYNTDPDIITVPDIVKLF